MRYIGTIGTLTALLSIGVAITPAYKSSSVYELQTGAIRTTFYRYGFPIKTKLTEVEGWPLASVPQEKQVWKKGGCTRLSSFFSARVNRVSCGINWGAWFGHNQLVWLLNEVKAPRHERVNAHKHLGDLLEKPDGWQVYYEPEDIPITITTMPIETIYAADYEGNKVYLWRREP